MGMIENLADRSRQVGGVKFEGARVNRQLIVAASQIPEPLPLLASDGAFWNSYLSECHEKGFGGSGFDLNCYFMTDLVVSGMGHLWLDGNIIVSDEVMRDYWRLSIPGLDLKRELALPVRQIEAPCVVSIGWGSNSFGHVLTEMLPRLVIAKETAFASGCKVKYLLDRSTQPWARNMISDSLGLSDDDLEYFDSNLEIVNLSRAIVPAFAINSRLHPYNCAIFDQIRANMGVQNGLCLPRVFISRSMITRKNAVNLDRICENEMEISAIAAGEFGFAVIAPETFPWREQVRIFTNVKIVAGMFGSALHGTLFSDRGTRVGAIGPLNAMQSHIAAIRRQHNLYLSTGKEISGQRFVVDTEDFRRFANVLVRTTEA